MPLTRDERLAQRAEARELMFRKAGPPPETLEGRAQERDDYCAALEPSKPPSEPPRALDKFAAPDFGSGRLAEKQARLRRERSDYEQRRHLADMGNRDPVVQKKSPVEERPFREEARPKERDEPREPTPRRRPQETEQTPVSSPARQPRYDTKREYAAALEKQIAEARDRHDEEDNGSGFLQFEDRRVDKREYAAALEAQMSERRRNRPESDGKVSGLDIGLAEEAKRQRRKIEYAAALRQQFEEQQIQRRRHQADEPREATPRKDNDAAMIAKKKLEYAAALRDQMAEKQHHKPSPRAEVWGFLDEQRQPQRRSPKKPHRNEEDDVRRSSKDDDDRRSPLSSTKKKKKKKKTPRSRELEDESPSDDDDEEPRRRRRPREHHNRYDDASSDDDGTPPRNARRVKQQQEADDAEDRHWRREDGSPTQQRHILGGLVGGEDEVRRQQKQEEAAKIAAELRAQIDGKKDRRESAEVVVAPPGYKIGPTGQAVRVDPREDAGRRKALASMAQPDDRREEKAETTDDWTAVGDQICDAETRSEAGRKEKANAYAVQLERDLVRRAREKKEQEENEKKREEAEDRRLAKERAELEEAYERDARHKAVVMKDREAIEAEIEERRRQKERDEVERRRQDALDDARLERERKELAAKFQAEKSPIGRVGRSTFDVPEFPPESEESDDDVQTRPSATPPPSARRGTLDDVRTRPSATPPSSARRGTPPPPIRAPPVVAPLVQYDEFDDESEDDVAPLPETTSILELEPLPTPPPPPPQLPTPAIEPQKNELVVVAPPPTITIEKTAALDLLPRAVAALKAALETADDHEIPFSGSEDSSDDDGVPQRRRRRRSTSVLARAGMDAVTPRRLAEAPAPAVDESFDLATHLDRNARRLERLRKLDLAADDAIKAADRGNDIDDALIHLAVSAHPSDPRDSWTSSFDSLRHR